ncbi:PP2C family protein-serine/threonine phosphatase [Streptomyces sp. MI02-7b]|uniref:PP2C family protein-serine/threonine phosphatase n=1 Tax=Streptomyces sp. MI02-7b TaxID=462941 RepID=UPI0029AF2CD1|nr:PP2C family protein-serine/threonine phosphatase [Streptomyces sp. MI02-7b]MDX3070826.1 PP2C family protein-serine/threonine phosphatase [Streptomyces sp. MI02-7b]
MHVLRRLRMHCGLYGRRDPVLLSPVLLTLVIGLLAVFTPQDVPFTRLLPAAPALAASVWSVRATLTLGVVCLLPVIGFALAFSDMSALYTAGAIGAVTLAAAYASHLRLQREHTLAQVRAVADATQEVLLRPVPRRIRNLEIATLYLAAAPQARVGGDFYAAADTAHGLRLILGDVRGKGLPAVGVSAAVLGSFHEAAYDAPDLGRLARRLDTSLARYNVDVPSPDGSERFATAVIVEIPPTGTQVSVLSCGHPPAVLVHRNTTRSIEAAAPSPPINLAELVGSDYHVQRIPFAPGDLLLLYTDGVTETRDDQGVFFPLTAWTRATDTTSPPAVLELLHQALLRHSNGRLTDDIACVAIRNTPRQEPW